MSTNAAHRRCRRTLFHCVHNVRALIPASFMASKVVELAPNRMLTHICARGISSDSVGLTPRFGGPDGPAPTRLPSYEQQGFS